MLSTQNPPRPKETSTRQRPLGARLLSWRLKTESARLLQCVIGVRLVCCSHSAVVESPSATACPTIRMLAGVLARWAASRAHSTPEMAASQLLFQPVTAAQPEAFGVLGAKR